MSSPRPSWRSLLAATSALFLAILALLAGQVKAGGDPAIGRGNTAAQQDQQAEPSGDDDDEHDDDDDEDDDDDGFIFGGSRPAPPVPGSESQNPSDTPTTHQS